MDPHYDQVKAMLPPLISGKTHEQLEQEVTYHRETKHLSHIVDGIQLPWLVTPSNLEALKAFEVRDDDVYIFTYLRSGI